MSRFIVEYLSCRTEAYKHQFGSELITGGDLQSASPAERGKKQTQVERAKTERNVGRLWKSALVSKTSSCRFESCHPSQIYGLLEKKNLLEKLRACGRPLGQDVVDLFGAD